MEYGPFAKRFNPGRGNREHNGFMDLVWRLTNDSARRTRFAREIDWTADRVCGPLPWPNRGTRFSADECWASHITYGSFYLDKLFRYVLQKLVYPLDHSFIILYQKFSVDKNKFIQIILTVIIKITHGNIKKINSQKQFIYIYIIIYFEKRIVIYL